MTFTLGEAGSGSHSLVPRPHPQEEERVWYLTSEFLVEHAYGNFVMQSDSHVTAVAPFEQRSLCIRLQRRSCFLFIARSQRSAWKDAYQQLTGRVVAGMATALPSCSLCSAVLAVAKPETRHKPCLRRERRRLPVLQILRSTKLPIRRGCALHL